MSLRTILAFAASLVTTLGCADASTPAADVQALLARDREWAQVTASSRNVDSIVAYWTDDARVIMAGHPVVAGKAAIREMVAGMMSIPGFRISWTPDSAVVSRSGDLAYTYGTNQVTAPDSAGTPVTTHGRYLTVWRKGADGQWRCAEDLSSPAPVGGNR